MPIYYWLDLLKETRIHTSFDELLLLKTYNDIIAIECCDIIITSLIKLPQKLNLLICYNNNLINLPELPNSLKELIIIDNNNNNNNNNNNDTDLINLSLSKLPNKLETIHFSQNRLKTLPILYNSLRELHCNINNLIKLPKLPNTLELLNCNNNQLTELPDLPNGLKNYSVMKIN